MTPPPKGRPPRHRVASSYDTPAWDTIHAELKENEELWQRLPFLGYQPSQDLLYEVRNCTDCGSTLYRPVTVLDEAIAAHHSRIERELAYMEELFQWKRAHAGQG